MNVCTGDIVKVLKFIGSILKLIEIVVPILLIIMGSIDFVKAMLSGNDDELKKSQSSFVKRIIAAVMVFLIPTIVGILLSLLNQTKSSCMTCILNTNTCNIINTNTTDVEDNPEKVTNDVCAQFINENDCNNNKECKWQPILNFNINISDNNGNYCVNTFFNR